MKGTGVFPEDWSGEPEGWTGEHARPSASASAPADMENLPKDSITGTLFRRRLFSSPLVGSNADITAGFAGMSINPPANSNQEDGKRAGGIRGLIRRASVSIKNRQRRHSQTEDREERPATAYKRLKTAISFHRNSRFIPIVSGDEHDPFMVPVPGNGNAPPLIPRGHGGAAARATAAFQNEYLRRQMVLPDDQFGDRESGIGIAVADSVGQSSRSTNNIMRIDFMLALPTELASLVLENLKHTDLRNAAMVSRRWADVSSSQAVWKKVFLRDQSKTFATSEPIRSGAGLGLPNESPENDWKDLFRIKRELSQNWKTGAAEAVYLNGHLDSIYCVQYDEYEVCKKWQNSFTNLIQEQNHHWLTRQNNSYLGYGYV